MSEPLQDIRRIFHITSQKVQVGRLILLLAARISKLSLIASSKLAIFPSLYIQNVRRKVALPIKSLNLLSQSRFN